MSITIDEYRKQPKTYREIIEELDVIAEDKTKSQEERDEARNKRNSIIAELTLRAYG
jgi:hypothetical protein